MEKESKASDSTRLLVTGSDKSRPGRSGEMSTLTQRAEGWKQLRHVSVQRFLREEKARGSRLTLDSGFWISASSGAKLRLTRGNIFWRTIQKAGRAAVTV